MCCSSWGYKELDLTEQLNNNKPTGEEIEVAQSCLTLCDPVDCSPPGSSIHGIHQARILEWVAISFSRGLPNPGIKLRSPTLQADALTSEPPGKPNSNMLNRNLMDMPFLKIGGYKIKVTTFKGINYFILKRNSRNSKVWK